MHCIPDALSRAPIDDPDEEDVEADISMASLSFQHEEGSVDLVMTKLKKKAKEDHKYQELLAALENGSFFKQRNNEYFKKFRPCGHLLSVENGLIYKGATVVIPENHKLDTLKELHMAHQGIEKTKRRARQTVFWPGISKDITDMVKSCEQCAQYRPSNPQEPLIQDDSPSRPFEMATTDFFSAGTKKYLVYADRYSGFPMVAWFDKEPTARQTISRLRRWFSLMGAPNVLRSDNGGQYDAIQTQQFLEDWGVQWIPSSPENPQSNGHAESMVKNVKYLIQKCDGNFESDECQKGMLELRNSPKIDGQSPAQRLFGRPLRNGMPINWRQYDEKWKNAFEEADSKLVKAKFQRRKDYNLHAKDLPKFNKGDKVLVQDNTVNSKRWKRPAVVVDRRGKHGRRYQLRFPSGRILWRNRQLLTYAPEERSS